MLTEPASLLRMSTTDRVTGRAVDQFLGRVAGVLTE
jgi:hypothetical protein